MIQKQKQQVRIIGGQWKSRKIVFPEGVNIRPTADRVRETLFNWLAPFIVDAHCLDLFAGSGALGFEALSRGAKSVIMVDKSPLVIKYLQETALQLDTHQADFYRGNFLKDLMLPSKIFNIVFLDPPFNQSLILQSCQWLLKNQFIKTDTKIYVEKEINTPWDLPPGFTVIKQGKTSQTAYGLIQLDKI